MAIAFLRGTQHSAGQGTFQPEFLCNSANNHEIKQQELHVLEEISVNAACAVSLSGFEIMLLHFSSLLLTAGQELSKLHQRRGIFAFLLELCGHT